MRPCPTCSARRLTSGIARRSSADSTISARVARSNVCFTGFALCVEGVERLLQAFFGGLPGVDRTFDTRRHAASSDLCFFRPKNAGPDQRVPVMARAISERLRYFWPSNINPLSSVTTSYSSLATGGPCACRTLGPELARQASSLLRCRPQLLEGDARLNASVRRWLSLEGDMQESESGVHGEAWDEAGFETAPATVEVPGVPQNDSVVCRVTDMTPISNCAGHMAPGIPSLYRSSAVQFNSTGTLNEFSGNSGSAHRAWERCR
jgi:hypothetical protein